MLYQHSYSKVVKRGRKNHMDDHEPNSLEYPAQDPASKTRWTNSQRLSSHFHTCTLAHMYPCFTQYITYTRRYLIYVLNSNFSNQCLEKDFIVHLSTSTTGQLMLRNLWSFKGRWRAVNVTTRLNIQTTRCHLRSTTRIINRAQHIFLNYYYFYYFDTYGCFACNYACLEP